MPIVFNTTLGTNIPKSVFVEFNLTTTPETVLLDNDGVTFTQIPNMIAGLMSPEFSVSEGVLTYNGPTRTFSVGGTSDLEANKSFEVAYALFINGVQALSETTVHNFTSTGKKENIAIIAIAVLNDGDTVEVRAKADGTASSSITVNKLDVVFIGLLT